MAHFVGLQRSAKKVDSRPQAALAPSHLLDAGLPDLFRFDAGTAPPIVVSLSSCVA